eukprot:scaffold87560_cov69-Attheya_sp.AAC.3
MGTLVTIKDPKVIKKSMISGHFNPVETVVAHRTWLKLVWSTSSGLEYAMYYSPKKNKLFLLA